MEGEAMVLQVANEAHPWVTLVVVMAVFLAAVVAEKAIGNR